MIVYLYSDGKAQEMPAVPLSIIIIPSSHAALSFNRSPKHFTREISINITFYRWETWAQRREMTCPRSPRRARTKQGIESRSPESQSSALSCSVLLMSYAPCMLGNFSFNNVHSLFTDTTYL